MAEIDPAISAMIRASFAAQGLMTTLGATIEAMAPGAVSLAAPITPAVNQQHDYAHAGLTFALGDSAAGYSALSVMPQEAEVLTTEMKINLVAPAAGKRLIATGEVIRAGRRLVIVRANVLAEDEGGAKTMVAVLQGTMIPV